jgi:hypothetical protein
MVAVLCIGRAKLIAKPGRWLLEAKPLALRTQAVSSAYP